MFDENYTQEEAMNAARNSCKIDKVILRFENQKSMNGYLVREDVVNEVCV